ncbi:DUF1593 domain-containing protein [Membranihabitans marinus]|uniref:DUF1593 domain-containing protein n=1 Tax=Membranihabitans marinus TaxID=1227546 RepID=UPI001F2F8E65|nr:DUF1593 domain-containing protein [Membranihabitans marinus]
MIKSIFVLMWMTAILVFANQANGQSKPQLIVLTDIGGDTDDEQSMVRLLLYSDVIDIKGFCITSRLGHGHDVKPEILNKQLQAYGRDYSMLLKHSIDYPHPEHLLSLVRNGLGNPQPLGQGFDTPASNHIIEVVDNTDDIIHVAIWGGQRELAQALWKVKENRSESELNNFCDKIQVHAIGDQDGHREYILKNFPKIHFVADGFAYMGPYGVRELASFRGMYMTGDQSMQDNEWVKKYIHGHGALSETYPVNGHGTIGMKEGDSPAFLGLIPNGLNVDIRPDWGGWGGRYRSIRPNLYIDAPDFVDGVANERHSVSQWRLDFQNDFLVRLQRCIKLPNEVNRHPIASFNDDNGGQIYRRKVAAGSKLVLKVHPELKEKEPDGQDLFFDWKVYSEINGHLNIRYKIAKNDKSIKIWIPEQGSDIHVVLRVRDSGSPSLTSYRRAILEIVE